MTPIDGTTIPEAEADDDDDDVPAKSVSPLRKSKNRLFVYSTAFLILLATIGGVYYFLFAKNVKEIPEEEKPITVLIVGNDTLHTNDVPNMLREVARMSKSWRPLDVTCFAREDWSLGDHIREKEAIGLIKGEHWDFVVLQDRWLQPLQDPAGMLESVQTLAKTARQKGTKVVLFVPWADAGQERQQEVLSAVSRKLAERLSIEVAPAGDVFFAVTRKYKDLNPYVGDKHHVSPFGAWLAGAALYAVITNQKAKLIADKFTYQGNDGEEPHVPVTGDRAKDIETIVWQIVNEENKGRRLGPPVLKQQLQGMDLAQ